MKNILQPAIDLAKEGFPVHPVAAYFWDKCGSCLQVPTNKHGCDMLLNGHPPKAGDVMVMPHLAATFEVTFSHLSIFEKLILSYIAVNKNTTY